MATFTERIQVMLNPEVSAWLEKEADERGVGVSVVARDLLQAGHDAATTPVDDPSAEEEPLWR